MAGGWDQETKWRKKSGHPTAAIRNRHPSAAAWVSEVEYQWLFGYISYQYSKDFSVKSTINN
jgi:hypothetical protein